MESSNSESVIKNMYHQGKIYKLVSNETDDVYIGSTCDSLSKRLSGHRADYKRWLNDLYNYVSSFEIVKYSDCKIILIEEFSCKNKDQLHRREREYIENTVCINRRKRVITTEDERRELHNKHQKEYSSSHKELISIKNNEYYENNKEQLNVKRRVYYDNNKEQLKEKFTCDCSGKYTRINKSVHDKTIMHKNYIALQNTIIPEIQNLQI